MSDALPSVQHQGGATEADEAAQDETVQDEGLIRQLWAHFNPASCHAIRNYLSHATREVNGYDYVWRLCGKHVDDAHLVKYLELYQQILNWSGTPSTKGELSNFLLNHTNNLL